MEVQQLRAGERKSLRTNSKSSLKKIDFGIRFTSDTMDIPTVVDISIVYKSKKDGIHTVWYGNPQDLSGAICDETRQCNGSSWNDDDLRISIDFSKLPTDIERMSIVTNILWGKDLSMHYGLMKSGYMRVFNHEENSDILEYHIDWSKHQKVTGMIWAEIYPYKNVEWKIKALEQPVNSKDLGELAQAAGSYL